MEAQTSTLATSAQHLTDVNDGDAYKKVANIIGVEMDKAWKSIISGIANTGKIHVDGEADGISLSDNQKVSEQDIMKFLTICNSAEMQINFTPSILQAQTCRFTAMDIVPMSKNGKTIAGGVEGSISVSVGVRF